MMKQSYYIWMLLVSLLALVGCRTEEPANPVAEEEEELCEIVISNLPTQKRAPADADTYKNTTYRAQLFYRTVDYYHWQRLDSLYSPYTGTYCDPKDANTWLTPCAVKTTDYTYDSSASPAEDSKYGLRAGKQHDYYLFLCSPAVPFVKYGTDVVKKNPLSPVPSGSAEYATLEHWGLQYERDGAATTHPAVSAGAKVSTKGITLQDTLRYNLQDSMELREYRSRIAFSVRCGDAISHANFKSLTIKGLRKDAVFQPFSKDFYFEDEASHYEDVVVYTCSDANGVRLERGCSAGAYTAGEDKSLTGASTLAHLTDRQTNTYFTYVLSGDYKSLKKVGDKEDYINTPAKLYVQLVSDGGATIDVDPVLLPFVFEPQKSYFYLITINSVYLAITVTARSWDTHFIIDETIDEDQGETYTFIIKDWTKHENTTSVEQGEGGGGDTPANATGGVNPGAWNTQSGGDSTVD